MQQRASALWRSMPSESEPGNRKGRSFWQQKAEREARARHAALESEWERRNPAPNAKTTSAARGANGGVKVARPLSAKRTVFELKRGAVGLRPDRVAKEVHIRWHEVEVAKRARSLEETHTNMIEGFPQQRFLSLFLLFSFVRFTRNRLIICLLI